MRRTGLAVGILIAAGLLLTTAMPAAAELEGWQYQREITIRENSGETLHDYQVLVGLDGDDFPGEAKSDGGDIRFTDADGTELSYWIEEFHTGSERARIWVNVPAITANGGAVILMRYGNPSAESVSDGAATFEFFDDFDGSSLNDDKWDLNVGENGGRVELSGGVCKLMSPNPAPSSCKITSKKLVNINSIFVVKRMKVTTGMDSRGPMQGQGFAGRMDVTTGEVKSVIDHGTEFKNEMWVRWAIARDGDSYAPYKDWADVGISEGTWYISGVGWYEEDGLRHVAWFKNNIEVSSMKYSSNDYIPSSKMYPYLRSGPYSVGSDNTGYMAVDYAFVRRYISSEPTITFSTIKPNIYKIRSNSLFDYTLSASPSPETPLVVDDDLEVKVNGETVFIDDDGYATLDGRASWKGDPITFSALPGDELEIIATNPGGGEIELSALYLHSDGESVHLSDGVPNTPGGDTQEFFRERFTITIPAPPPSVRIIGLPSTIHGGEDVEVTVGWENVPPNWKLVVSLEKSETDKDRLADDENRTISGTGEALFKLNTHQIDETYNHGLVWASLRDENDNWKGIYTNAGTTVLPAATRASQIAATPEPSPARARTPALVDRIATSTPTRKQDDDTTQMLKLAGGAIIALIAIMLLAVKLRRNRRDATFELLTTKETKYREAQEEIKSAESSIGKAKEFGCCDVAEAEERLKDAKQLFGKGAYEEVIEAAKQTGELVKKIKEESKPDVTIIISQTSFKPNEWKRIDLAIKNIGTATAKAINVEYPKERVEIEDLIEVKELKPNEETKLRIVFRPIHTGEVPLKTKITYKDFDNKEYKEEKTFWITVGKEKPLPPEGSKLVIESGTEFFNGFIRLKIAVTNPMSQIMTDVSLDLDFDENTLRLDRHEPESYPDKKGKVQLGNINPDTSKTVSFYLDPMTCAKAGTDIDCRVDYKDAYGKPDSIRMESEKVEIVCPVFRTESDINIGMLKEFIENLPCHDHKVYRIPAGFETNKLIDICRETIQMHDVRHVRTFHTKDGKTCETWYYGKTKVDKSDIVIKARINEETESIEIFAATPAHKSLTGLLAELGHNLTDKIKEIGKMPAQIVNVSMENVIIQHSNLLNSCDMNDVCSGDIIIEDSVIQRSKIGGIGEGTGASSVNIRDSVVQRSPIGSTRKCQSCGVEVQADAEFCTECGTKLG